MILTLSEREMEVARKVLQREPNEAEWRMLDVLWSEHCSYKSSKVFLRSLPSEGPNVVMSVEDWQDAGAVDIGDGLALVLKVESHNHPSAVDPFNGAATGVGGILRDIISKGAMPIALLDMIRVGELNEKGKWLLRNIIAGIGFYGNSVGVPVVGGELSFDSTYNDNPLVDVACVGIVDKGSIVPSVVKEPGLRLVLTGFTGLDGLGGASFASRKLSGNDEIGAVQIADPFAGKIVIDSTLEVIKYVDAIKDLGGGGLAVAVTEMANGLGAIVNLEKVPLRVKELLPEEIIISETQERMLFAVKPENVEKVCSKFKEFNYPCEDIGEITPDRRVKFLYNGKTVADLPSELLLSPPLNLMPSERAPRRYNVPKDVTIEEAINKVLSHPDLVSKEIVYSQYDYEVGTSTLVKPGEADSAVLELPNGRLLALKADANQDLCSEDPYECGKSIVAESFRNLSTVGARGIALVDHLQFGDPRKPHVYQDFIESLRGIAEASRFFSTPIVGGKVSFHNEDKDGNPIKPTPLVVMAGLIEDKVVRNEVREGTLVLLGNTRDETRGTLFSRIFGSWGEVPKARLMEDLLASKLILKGISEDKVLWDKDVSKGGLAGALLPIIVKGYSVKIFSSSIIGTSSLIGKMFSENGGRFLVITDDPQWFTYQSGRLGIQASIVGKVEKGSSLWIDNKEFKMDGIIDNYFSYLEKVVWS
ncbi:MAG: phosphoribosylformylglycinamidine synthase subunit PurL [Metallosphaera sp.]|uniref:Phosphoribosylformylglycinamidine synthase subunit PurL n=1 Tax=Metallosphaera cuprina (strain Ar-4) TaxID=1006006 RepID=F4FZA4_METCR|nr:phosphoribosylformylglycinamidine synthase subunit PurL [Metallosphaera cuprina]AEB94413.1 phosphoribosylformylglycinamidine synthase II [Metallosphaera cuprina Ar-4]